LTAQIADELNVRALEPLDGSDAELVSHTVRPNFRALGKRFGNETQPVAAAIAAFDAAALAGQLRDRGTAEVSVNGVPISIGPEEVIVTQTARSGWAVAADAGETVAIEVAITPELRREGLARDAIRLVQ